MTIEGTIDRKTALAAPPPTHTHAPNNHPPIDMLSVGNGRSLQPTNRSRTRRTLVEVDAHVLQTHVSYRDVQREEDAEPEDGDAVRALQLLGLGRSGEVEVQLRADDVAGHVHRRELLRAAPQRPPHALSAQLSAGACAAATTRTAKKGRLTA